jgi:hypothetical protein
MESDNPYLDIYKTVNGMDNFDKAAESLGSIAPEATAHLIELFDSAYRMMFEMSELTHLDMQDPGGFGAYMRSSMAREVLAHYFAFAIPNDKALDTLAKHAPLIEIGAGTGYWTSLLRKRGVNILAYDIAPPLDGKNNFHPEMQFSEVLSGSHEILANHSDRTLFLCWPPYQTPMAVNCLNSFRGKTMVYIGEPSGGCTANDRFFDIISKNWRCIKTIEIPKWIKIRDKMFVFRRCACAKRSSVVI